MTIDRATPPEPLLKDGEKDMQAIVAAGFNTLAHGEFFLLRIKQPALARAWLARLLEAKLVAVVTDVGRGPTPGQRQEVVTIALTHAGLLRIGLPPSATRPFPTTFANGMGDIAHARMLGDDASAAPWRWSDTPDVPGDPAWLDSPDTPDTPAPFLAHLLVAHYWSATATSTTPELQRAKLEAEGFDVMQIPGDPAFIQGGGSAMEAFGFRDGIAQPVIAGLRADDSSRHRKIGPARPEASDRLVAAGEFVLGYTNEYGERAYAPGPSLRKPPAVAFGLNGSYVAVRQIVQHVQALRDFEAAHPSPPAPRGELPPPTIAERMLGRYRDGRPVGVPDLRAPALDDFRYRMEDSPGFGCPRGAHVRRANPRDGQGVDSAAGIASSKLHRLLRRGRSYLLEDGERGLFFMALNADLDRQFAFVQSQWIQSTTFGDLADDADPVLGTGKFDPLLGKRVRNFTVQCPVLATRHTDVPAFTTVVGGGYFFLPGLAALHELTGT